MEEAQMIDGYVPSDLSLEELEKEIARLEAESAMLTEWPDPHDPIMEDDD
jgi:hypothetical protein